MLINVEDIEDYQAKKAEIPFMNAFATQVLIKRIEAAWETIMPNGTDPSSRWCL